LDYISNVEYSQLDEFVLTPNLYPDFRANSAANIRIVATSNLFKMAFYPENEVINASRAFTIL